MPPPQTSFTNSTPTPLQSSIIAAPPVVVSSAKKGRAAPDAAKLPRTAITQRGTILYHKPNRPGALIKCAFLPLLGALLSLCTPAALSKAPKLLLNINTTAAPQNSSPQYLGRLGGKVLFGATDASGAGLWTTNGTAAGTVLVHRLTVTAQTIFPGVPNFFIFKNRGYFVGDDGTHGAEPWSTDGTAAGTSLLKDLASGPSASNPQFLASIGPRLVFSARDGAGVQQMYVTDGTSRGTHALTSFSADEGGGVTTDIRLHDKVFQPVGDRFYFVHVDNAFLHHIWVSDGTVPGTHEVTPGSDSIGLGASSETHGFTPVGNLVLYVSNGLLWSIDNTTGQIAEVVAVGGTPFLGPPNVDETFDPVRMNGFALFLASDLGFGPRQLWRSDGTAAGTYCLATIGITPNTAAGFLQRVGDRAIFIGQDDQNGIQLWSTDGTTANTMRLTSASEPSNEIFPIAIYATTLGGTTAYLSRPDGLQSRTWSLWRTDGTLAGTRRVTGLPSIDQSEAGLTRVTGDATAAFVEISNPVGTTSLFKYDPIADASATLSASLNINVIDGFLFTDGTLYFSSTDPLTGDEPWLSDGTSRGTRLIVDLNPEVSDIGSDPDEFVALGNALVFTADDGVHGRELWRSDGTTNGTRLLADVNPGAVSSNPNHLFVGKGALYFFATDANGSQKFMRFATVGGTVQALATLSPPDPPFPGGFGGCPQTTPVVLNGNVYFSAADGSSGQELWTTDGTVAGTHRVADINPGAADAFPCYLAVLGSRIYFAATGPNGTELWSSDGSTVGTMQVADIAPGPVGSNPFNLVAFKGRLYFSATDGLNGSQVWSTDGTAVGTTTLAHIGSDPSSFAFPVGALPNALLIEAEIFQTQPLGTGLLLWSTDGTAANTARLGTVTVGNVFLDNGVVAFLAGLGGAGPEPWISDGTATGTHFLADINPTSSTTLLWFESFNRITLFGVTDPSFGEHLWRSDGTTAGTTLVGFVPTEPNYNNFGRPSAQHQPAARHRLTVKQTFFFVGNDPQTGSELYALTSDSRSMAPDSASSNSD